MDFAFGDSWIVKRGDLHKQCYVIWHNETGYDLSGFLFISVFPSQLIIDIPNLF